MLRALWFLTKLCLLLAGIIWLLQRPGKIEIEWLGYIVTTSVGVAAGLLILLIGIWTLLYRFYRSIVSVPAVYRRYQVSARREKGYRAVTSGLVAIAAGDARSAEKFMTRAQNMIPDAPLTKLLSAQSALMNGNAPRARREFTALLEDDDAAFFGLRGLLNEHLRDKNYGAAAALLEKAERMQPRKAWVARSLFDLETRGRNWKKAEVALKRAERLRIFNDTAARRHRQAILTAEGDEALVIGDAAKAAKHFSRAFDIDPAFPPVAARLAQTYIALDKKRAAIKTLERAFVAHPHPELAQIWMTLAPHPRKNATAYEAGQARYAWMQHLCELKPDHRDSLRAMGLAALDARLWAEARRHLLQSADYRALARLEREENRNDTKAREWLEMAADHPPENKWTCTSCGHTAAQWHAVCHECSAFNTQEWMMPEGAVHYADRPPALSPDLIGPPTTQ